MDGQPLPLYGDGLYVRDWLYVEDHARALLFVLEHGTPGETYNIGGGNEIENIEITRRILRILDRPESLIRRVTDRPGHDRRYALSTDKLRKLGWSPKLDFEKGIEDTVKWYVENEWWWRPIKEKDGQYREWYEKNYAERLKET